MITIRNETPDDVAAVRNLQYRAFRNHPQHEPGAEPTEHRIVDGLREAGALSLSLVAEDRGAVAGHIAFSPVLVGGENVNWFALGPVGVLPEKQGQGTGSALVEAGIKRLRTAGAAGIVLVGDPGFYGRFGFRSAPELTMPGVPAQYILALALRGETPPGALTHHPAFHVGA